MTNPIPTADGKTPLTIDEHMQDLENFLFPNGGCTNTSAEPTTMTLDTLNQAMNSLLAMPKVKPLPKFFSNPYLTECVQYSRSPARAERRAKKGYPQHFATRPMQTIFSTDGENYYGHPVIIDAVKKEIEHAQGI